MKPNHLFRIVSLLVLASAALTAQVARQENVVQPKNWATPLYWQPNQAEREAAGRAVPQLEFPGGTNCPGGTAGTGTGGTGCAISTNALTFVAITPCTLADTRGNTGFNGMVPFSGYGSYGTPIPINGHLNLPVQLPAEATADTAPAPCGVIPNIAQAYSFIVNMSVPSGGPVEYLQVYPYSTTAQPNGSTLNDPLGQIVSSAVIAPAGPINNTYYGGVTVYNSGPAAAHVWIYMNGYFAAPTDLYGNTAIGTGTLAGNTSGVDNTASGSNALESNTAGSYNTASGSFALQNSNGNGNTASGYQALAANQSGNYNTASGYQALAANQSGNYNTASGVQALEANQNGSGNTASGEGALQNNTAGSYNTASGGFALRNNSGSNNTATGYEALYNNSADNDTAFGFQALGANDSGTGNTAVGYQALGANDSGTGNTAVGYSALTANTTGDNNIAIGILAAYNLTTGSNNIDIGSQGVAGDDSTIKIGTEGVQRTTYIAGIYGAGVSGVPAYINSNGQLGTVLSSRRFKKQITDMGDNSSKLLQLRPVNFFYKPEYDDGSHLLQYGLIAEEVAKVYPEMVAYDNDGQILTVKYQLLAPMLLNEVQKQNAQLQLQKEENRKLEDRLAALETLLPSQAAAATRPAGSQ